MIFVVIYTDTCIRFVNAFGRNKIFLPIYVLYLFPKLQILRNTYTAIYSSLSKVSVEIYSGELY